MTALMDHLHPAIRPSQLQDSKEVVTRDFLTPSLFI